MAVIGVAGVQAGALTNVSAQIGNSGTADAPAGVITGFYLSSDATLSADDTFLVDTFSAAFTIAPRDHFHYSPYSTTVPSLSPGAYYLIARVDHPNAVAELDETNNTLARAFNVLWPD